jgi:hypothetical protein
VTQHQAQRGLLGAGLWALMALPCLSAAPAHAWTFKPYTVLMSTEAGIQDTVLRYSVGTRKTPQHAVNGGFNVEVGVLHSPFHPHRLSVLGGLAPSAFSTLTLPDWGARPGLNRPFTDTGLFRDPALGLSALGGVRYRWETGFALVPFAEATGVLSLHKVVNRPGHPHVNLAVRAGGGLEYYVLHRYALFAAFNLRGGPLLWPLPAVIPWPEAAADMVVGMRFRAF